MPSFEQIKEFLPAQGDWITYTKRLSYYFEANSFTDTNIQKRQCFSQCVERKYSLY